MISAEIPRTPFLNRNLFENARDDSRGVCLGQEIKTNCKDCKLPDFNVNGGQKRVNSGRWPVVGVIIISECRPILHIWEKGRQAISINLFIISAVGFFTNLVGKL